MTVLAVLVAVVGALVLGWRCGRRDADGRIAGLEADVEQQRLRADVLQRRLRNRMTPWSPAQRPVPPPANHRNPSDPPGDVPPGEEPPLRPLDDDVRFEAAPRLGWIVPVTGITWAVPT